jgi:hypothetical protein
LPASHKGQKELGMKHYFFHMACKERLVLDEKGRELSCIRAAHQHALRLIHQTMTYLQPEDVNGWMVKVANDNGRTELIVLFPARVANWS